MIQGIYKAYFTHQDAKPAYRKGPGPTGVMLLRIRASNNSKTKQDTSRLVTPGFEKQNTKE